ncbi:hypothetical protein GCM10027317_22570 [Massilia agri]
MKPELKMDGEALTASEPSKLGRGRKTDGGATAPAHSAEQALHEECAFFVRSGTGASSSAAAAAWCAA